MPSTHPGDKGSISMMVNAPPGFRMRCASATTRWVTSAGSSCSTGASHIHTYIHIYHLLFKNHIYVIHVQYIHHTVNTHKNWHMYTEAYPRIARPYPRMNLGCMYWRCRRGGKRCAGPDQSPPPTSPHGPRSARAHMNVVDTLPCMYVCMYICIT